MISVIVKRSLAGGAAVLLALPTAAHAQGGMAGHHAGAMTGPGQAAVPGGMMGGMMGGGMMMLGPTPGFILGQKDALGLTDEQIARLDSLQGQAAEVWQAHHAMMQGIHQQMAGLRQAESPDLDRYQKLMQQMASAGAAMHVQLAKLGQEAEQVLTPDQRSKLRYGMQLMSQRGATGHDGMMGRGMGGGYGMMGGQGMMGRGMGGGYGMMGRGGSCPAAPPADSAS